MKESKQKDAAVLEEIKKEDDETKDVPKVVNTTIPAGLYNEIIKAADVKGIWSHSFESSLKKATTDNVTLDVDIMNEIELILNSQADGKV